MLCTPSVASTEHVDCCPDLTAKTEPSLPSGLGWRNEAELLHHAHNVGLTRDFGHLAIRNSIDGDDAIGYMFSGRRSAHELAGVRPAKSKADDDLIAFGNDVLKRCLKIGKHIEESREELFGCFDACRHSGGRNIVSQEIGTKIGECSIQVVFVHQVNVTANERLVLFG